MAMKAKWKCGQYVACNSHDRQNNFYFVKLIVRREIVSP